MLRHRCWPPPVKTTGGLRGWYRKALELPDIVATGRAHRHLTSQKAGVSCARSSSALAGGQLVQPFRGHATISPKAMGCLELVGDGHSVTPFATTLSTPDHTPGHLSVIITSGGEKAVIAGDLFHSSVQVTEADWCSGADTDKDTARQSRHAALDRLESEGFPLAAGHLPVGTSIGKIVRIRGAGDTGSP